MRFGLFDRLYCLFYHVRLDGDQCTEQLIDHLPRQVEVLTLENGPCNAMQMVVCA